MDCGKTELFESLQNVLEPIIVILLNQRASHVGAHLEHVFDHDYIIIAGMLLSKAQPVWKHPDEVLGQFVRYLLTSILHDPAAHARKPSVGIVHGLVNTLAVSAHDVAHRVDEKIEQL